MQSLHFLRNRLAKNRDMENRGTHIRLFEKHIFEAHRRTESFICRQVRNNMVILLQKDVTKRLFGEKSEISVRFRFFMDFG